MFVQSANGFVEQHEKLEVLGRRGPLLIYIFQRTWNLVDRVGGTPTYTTRPSSSKLSLCRGLASNLQSEPLFPIVWIPSVKQCGYQPTSSGLRDRKEYILVLPCHQPSESLGLICKMSL